jgi:hypothetical protein
MQPRNVPKWVFWIVWVIVTIPHLMITFNRTLPIYISKAKEVNGLIANWSLTFSTSLLFWLIVEWLAEQKQRREASRVQRLFLDRLLARYNKVAHNLQGKYIILGGVQARPLPNYLFTVSHVELTRLVQEHHRRVTEELMWPEDHSRNTVVLIVRHFFRGMARHRDNYAPHFYLFEPTFNEKVSEMFDSIEGEVDLVEDADMSRALNVLRSAQDHLLQVENLFRAANGQPVIGSPNK